MIVRVLGSATAGGFPQWNCNCANCDGVRKGRIKASRRTESSVAVSDDGEEWVLLHASPDLRAQISAFPPLQPGRAIRDTGIAGIVLINSQIDRVAGLLLLREGKPLNVCCTDMVYQDLTTGFPVLSVLGHYCGVKWNRIDLAQGGEFRIAGLDGLRFTAVAVKSKAPPYSPHRHDPHVGDTIAVRIEDARNGKNAFYAPALGEIEPHLRPVMEAADCLLMDGTYWRDDEMEAMGIVPAKRAREIGHLPQSGPGGMLEVLAGFPGARKVLAHVNNTNPILDECSPERAELERRGIEVAYDGMEITL